MTHLTKNISRKVQVTQVAELIGLIFTLTLIGCSDQLPQYSKLSKLRVLSLRADQPEVGDFGTAVTLTPWISDINGNGRGLQYSYQQCIDPGIGYGAQPTCGPTFSNPNQISAVGIPRKTYTGSAPAFTVTLPSQILGPTLSAAQKFNGIAYLIIYRLQSQDLAETVTAFKRIIVSTNTIKNNNPVISTVLSNGNVLTTLPFTSSYPTSQVNLSVTLNSNSIETYQKADPNGSNSTATESITLTWFYSDGTTQFERTSSTATNQWTPPSLSPVGRSAVIVVVARDGRGGEDTQQIEFQ
jgi:hypothetical protein